MFLQVDGPVIESPDMLAQKAENKKGKDGKKTQTVVSIAPGEGQSPVPLFMDPDAEYLTFPKLFPKGRFGMHAERRIHLTVKQYLKNRLLHSDSRFAQNCTYLFWALYFMEYTQLMSSISIQLRKGAQRSKFGEDITVDKALNSDRLNEWIKHDNGFRFMNKLRGSPAYWRTTLFDLIAMVRQLGVPTWFLTLSAADLQWYDTLAPLFEQEYGRVPTEEEVENLPWKEKTKLLRKYPVPPARLFNQKVNSFFTNVLKSPQQPLGKVVDYFYRFEWQARGSPHIHCLVWIEGAPIIGKDSDETICNFIDTYISGKLPDVAEHEDELHHLVSQLQRHNHRATCQKKELSWEEQQCIPTKDDQGKPISEEVRQKLIKDLKCRFNYPRQQAQITHLRYPPPTEAEIEAEKAASEKGKKLDKKDSLQSKNIKVVLQRGPDDVYINNYNPWILSLWKANMDIQYVTNAYACIFYICSYIAKAEQEVGEAMQAVGKELPPDCPPRKKAPAVYQRFFQSSEGHSTRNNPSHSGFASPEENKRGCVPSNCVST